MHKPSPIDFRSARRRSGPIVTRLQGDIDPGNLAEHDFKLRLVVQ